VVGEFYRAPSHNVSDNDLNNINQFLYCTEKVRKVSLQPAVTVNLSNPPHKSRLTANGEKLGENGN